MYDRVRDSYDRVAQRYADEVGDELAGKPLDRALLSCLVELVKTVPASPTPALVPAESIGLGPPCLDAGPLDPDIHELDSLRPELPAAALIGDLGCGPGHISGYLADLGVPVVGIDISPAMVEVGRHRYPQARFRVGSLLALPATDGELAGAIAFYSIIHLRPEHRASCYRELARVIRPGGWLLLAFHVGLVGREDGGILHAEQWWGEQVDLDFYYLDPGPVAADVAAAGFTIVARTDREPWAGVEHESRRCYLLCRRA